MLCITSTPRAAACSPPHAPATWADPLFNARGFGEFVIRRNYFVLSITEYKVILRTSYGVVCTPNTNTHRRQILTNTAPPEHAVKLLAPLRTGPKHCCRRVLITGAFPPVSFLSNYPAPLPRLRFHPPAALAPFKVVSSGIFDIDNGYPNDTRQCRPARKDISTHVEGRDRGNDCTGPKTPHR